MVLSAGFDDQRQATIAGGNEVGNPASRSASCRDRHFRHDLVCGSLGSERRRIENHFGHFEVGCDGRTGDVGWPGVRAAEPRQRHVAGKCWFFVLPPPRSGVVHDASQCFDPGDRNVEHPPIGKPRRRWPQPGLYRTGVQTGGNAGKGLGHCIRFIDFTEEPQGDVPLGRCRPSQALPGRAGQRPHEPDDRNWQVHRDE